jgi:hypothetical protein
VRNICKSKTRMKRGIIVALGLLTALLGVGYGAQTNLRITLRLTDTTRAAVRLRGDSARIQTRLDLLYDEPGFRPPRERAKVEGANNRIVVTVSDTSGAKRIEYLASTQGLVSFRLVAADSVAADVMDSADNWVRRHPTGGLDSLNGAMWYHWSDLLVSDKDYPKAAKALAGIDTLVFGDWRPMFGSFETRRDDTSRALYLVARQAEMSNERRNLVEHVEVRRFRGTRPPNAPPMPEQTWPYFVDMWLTHDTLLGFDPADRLARVTGAHIRRRLAMTMDSSVLSAPMIQDTLTDGIFSVRTNDTLGFHARDLATVLRSGPLFTPLVVERVERVGAK